MATKLKAEQTHVPLQVTKDLLKPWGPCSDGYKWFLEKFPQGAEYTAVQKALRADRRFDDARWLSNQVWDKLILAEPSTTADVVADHKAEALEIIADTTALKVEGLTVAELQAAGATLENDGGKREIKIGSSGDYARIGSSGDYAQIGSSGDYARIGSSGYSARIGSSGDSAQIGSSGDYARIGSSGYSARIGSSGDYARIGSSGYSARIGSSGDSARINATGKDAVIACAGLHSRARAGVNGVIALPWHDEAAKRTRIAVGYVGEDLKAGVWYEVQGGHFVEVQP